MKKPYMKKSQFYMFAAVLLILAVFLIVMNKPYVNISRLEDLQAFLDNYVYEAHIVLNNAVFYNKNASEALMNATEEFIEYAEAKNLELGIATIFSMNGKVGIVNYINEPLLIKTSKGEEISLSKGQQGEVDFADAVEVDYLNESYYYYFTGQDAAELKTLFVKENA